MSESLDSIGIRMMTDKASQFSRTYAKPHDYLRHMERFVEPMRYNPIKILEIGVGGGESVQTWLEYFEQALVFGVDIVHDTNPWNTQNSNAHKRYTFVYGDQSSPIFWKSFIRTCGPFFDLIIDDGSHKSADIILTLNHLWPALMDGGLYQVEDLNSAIEARAFVKTMALDNDQGRGDLDALYLARELAILRKR